MVLEIVGSVIAAGGLLVTAFALGVRRGRLRQVWVLERLDNGITTSLASYAGGGAPGGAWSRLSIMRTFPHGDPPLFRDFIAVDLWRVSEVTQEPAGE